MNLETNSVFVDDKIMPISLIPSRIMIFIPNFVINTVMY